MLDQSQKTIDNEYYDCGMCLSSVSYQEIVKSDVRHLILWLRFHRFLLQLMGEDWTAEGVQSGDLEVLQENAAASSENVAAGTVVEGQQSEAAPSSSVGEQVIFVTAPSTSTAEPQAGEKRSAATARLADIVNSDVKHYRMSVAEAAPVTNDNLHR